MALRYGFFASQNGDRVYTDSDMRELLRGLISNGIVKNYLEELQVTATVLTDNVTVQVHPGKAYINGGWAFNDTNYGLLLDPPDPALPRIDGVYLTFSSRKSSRRFSFGWKTGTPASNPVRPTLNVDSSTDAYITLAYILIPAGGVGFTPANITDMRSSNECGWVQVPGVNVSTDTLFKQWEAAYAAAMAAMQTDVSGVDEKLNQFGQYITQKEAEAQTKVSGLDDTIAGLVADMRADVADVDQQAVQFGQYITQKETEAQNKVADMDKTISDLVAGLQSEAKKGTLIRQYTQIVVTAAENTAAIQIDKSKIPDLTSLDLFNVYVNGFRLPSDQYTYTLTEVTLTRPLLTGQTVEIVVQKTIDGSMAQTVVGQIEDLQRRIAALEAK